jgi:hypothetical protein
MPETVLDALEAHCTVVVAGLSGSMFDGPRGEQGTRNLATRLRQAYVA